MNLNAAPAAANDYDYVYDLDPLADIRELSDKLNEITSNNNSVSE